MKAADIPTIRFSIPFADLASVPSLRREIPVDSQVGITDGAASLQTGFPPLNFQPKTSGGVPPFGSDFNGIFYETTAWIRWYNAAAAVTRDAGFVTDIGGYPAGAVIPSTLLPGWYWRSVSDDNLVDPDLAADAGWVVDQRVRLLADLTVYVGPAGSDSNFGLSSGTAFLTMQAAWNFCQSTFDLNGFLLKIQVLDGTYTDGLVASGPMVGQGVEAVTVQILGNDTTPSNCVINVATGRCFYVSDGAKVAISGFKLSNASGSFLEAGQGGFISAGAMNYGTGSVAGTHIVATNGGVIYLSVAYTISGSTYSHLTTRNMANIATAASFLITLTGTPAFSSVFAFAEVNSTLQIPGLTFSGAATGVRYSVISNSTINTGGGGAAYLPGSSSGSSATGGQYV